MFNKEFDRSLWIILESDAENRKEIIEFLKSIPEELMKEIRNILSSQHDGNKKEQEKSEFEGQVVASDGTTYSFLISYGYGEKSLEITQELSHPEDENITYLNFSTELNLVDEDLSFPIDENDEFWLGNFTKTCSINTKRKLKSPLFNKKFVPFLNESSGEISPGGYMEEHEFEYNLVNTREGYQVRKSKLRDYQVLIPVDITTHPTKLTLKDIEKRYEEEDKTKKKRPSCN